MHFIAFSGQMHRDREEGASSALLYKRASRCHYVSSLSRLNKTILAHYSMFNKIATLGYIMAHEGMGTDHYSMSRLTMRRSHSSTGYCYNEVNSNLLPINTGVPQGSILGPLLFIIYINDFARASAIFEFICYADDTTLFSTLNKFINAQNINPDIIINTELAKINEWLEINKLSLNVTKSKFMVFHTQQKHRAIKPPVPKINNTNIEKVEQFKFLGLTLDSNLNWKKHSDNITNKCSQIIGILNRLKHNILPQSIKIMLYNALLLPHINYCLVTWGYQCKRINILQKRAVRLITLSKYNSHTAPLFKKLKLLTIKDTLALQELKFYYKLTHNELPDYFQNWQIVTHSELHQHNTRRKHDIHIVGFIHTFAKRCIRINLPRTLNATSQSVKDKLFTHSVRGFVNYAKFNFLQSYKNDCTVANCYICARLHN